MDMQLEEELIVWIEERRNDMLRVSRQLIIYKAKTMYHENLVARGLKLATDDSINF